MNTLRRTSAVFLLMLVLISSSSFMVGLHFCGGEIQNIALFDKAPGCEKEKQLPPCHRHETPACCKDAAVVHDGDEFSAAKAEVSVTPSLLFEVAQAPVILSEVIESAPLSSPHFYNYDPPLRAANLTVTLHTFLI